MRLDTVESDVIHAIGHDNETNVLEIIFHNGQIYQYRNVPRSLYEQFLAGDSNGKYFQENIRDEFEYWQWDVEMAKFIRAEHEKQWTRIANDSRQNAQCGALSF